jgi:hypothetical protein
MRSPPYGVGGTREVFQATDTKLKHQGPVRVLPERVYP